MTGPEVDLSARLGRLRLPGAVLTASGCAGSGRELRAFLDLSALGAFTTPSVTLEARRGRRTPRVVETTSGLLTALGLPGAGVDAFLARDLPWLTGHGARVIVSIAGGTLADYAELARRVGRADGIAAVEVNLSSPDASDRGEALGRDPYQAQRVVGAVRDELPHELPVFAKLAPDVGSIVDLAEAVVRAGVDGLTLVNAQPGMAIDPVTLRPALGSDPAAGGAGLLVGGLSGPAIRPLAVRAVYLVHAAVPDLPLIGTGGVRTGWDALELILAGASAVAVGSVLLDDPGAVGRISAELATALAAHGLDSVAAASGLAHRAPSSDPHPTPWETHR